MSCPAFRTTKESSDFPCRAQKYPHLRTGPVPPLKPALALIKANIAEHASEILVARHAIDNNTHVPA